ncbi:MAG: LCP family protein [Ruminococcus sp.]|nr:LCP family protein [Ruminococcus sp.]
MANRKKGSIAIPFLLTFLIALLLIGGFVVYIYKSIDMNKEKEIDDMYATDYNSATYEDSHTILFVLDIPEEQCSSTFVVMRSVPKEKKLLLTGIPTNTITLIDGKQENLKNVYDNMGIASAEKFIEQISGIEIDRYMIFNEDAFLKLSDIMGGVSYGVTVDIPGLQETNKEQYLNGKQTIKFLTYPMFSGGEFERASIAGSVMSAMINQSDGPNLAKGFERNFNTIVNMTNTNITAGDYKKLAYPIDFMLTYGTAISHFSTIKGTADKNYYVIDEFYSDEIINEYFTDKSKSEKK